MTMENSVFAFHDSPAANVIKTSGTGKAGPDDARWLSDQLLQRAKSQKGRWYWLAHISQMDPILDPETSKILADLHQKAEASGCAAIMFVAGGTAAIKVQAQRHNRAASSDKLIVEFFRTEEDALEWLNEP